MTLNILQIIVAVFLILAILMQNRGTGLGAAFGGEGNMYRAKRGVEKQLFTLTIVLAVVFLTIAFLNALAIF